MPAIDIYYRKHIATDMNFVKLRFRECVAQLAAEHFSSESIKLTKDDFSIVLHEPGCRDSLSHDIIVRLQLHAFPERLSETDDKAGKFAAAIADELSAIYRPRGFDEPVTVGVSLLVAEIGWGAASSEQVQG